MFKSTVQDTRQENKKQGYPRTLLSGTRAAPLHLLPSRLKAITPLTVGNGIPPSQSGTYAGVADSYRRSGMAGARPAPPCPEDTIHVVHDMHTLMVHA